MTGTRLNDCTPTPDEQAKYTISDAEREAQIREQWISPNWSELCHNYPVPTLLRLLDEARSEIARLRAPPEADVMERAHKVISDWRPDWPIAAIGDATKLIQILVRSLTAYGDQRARDARQQILVDSTPLREAVAREARASALEEAAQLCDDLWVGNQGKSVLAPKIRALKSLKVKSQKNNSGT
jgi:hypothetical protein